MASALYLAPDENTEIIAHIEKRASLLVCVERQDGMMSCGTRWSAADAHPVASVTKHCEMSLTCILKCANIFPFFHTL